MVNRVSALDGHYRLGHFGVDGRPGVLFHLQRDLVLHQLAVWPSMTASQSAEVAAALGVDQLPAPCRSAVANLGGQTAALLRTEPLKYWLAGASLPALEPDLGVSLDLSHSRTQINVGGEQSTALLNRLLPLDLRDAAMPPGAVASSVTHHVGVTLWRRQRDPSLFSLFIPRGFAVSVWQMLMETALQFGVNVE